MTGQLGNILWSNQKLSSTELELLLHAEPKEILPFFSKIESSLKHELFEYLILNNYADNKLLISCYKTINPNELTFDCLYGVIPRLISEGEILLSKQALQNCYSTVIRKNLLNKIKTLKKIRLDYFPFNVDFLFNEILFYFENMMNEEVLECSNEIDELFKLHWRKLEKTKTKAEYEEIVKDLYSFYKNNDYRFYKKYLLYKSDYTKKEKTELLLLAGVEQKLLDLIFSKMSIEQQALIEEKLNYKKPHSIRGKLILKEKAPEIIPEVTNTKVEYKRISEEDRSLLIESYLNKNEAVDDESYVIGLIKAGYFDQNESINDLIIGLFHIGYDKAVKELVRKYDESINKLTYAELLLTVGEHFQAKLIASEVLENEEELDFIEWAKKVCHDNE